mgnify:CR=1 FL=1
MQCKVAFGGDKVCNADGSTALSKTLPITSGVYQGGSLSCLLFTIFINDICLHVPGVTIVQYADDTQILVSGKRANLNDLIDKMEQALSKLFTWFCTNNMKVNAAKTQMIVLGTRQMLKDLPPVTIQFSGTTVKESAKVKNLGIVMDRHLTFHDHVSHVVAKCTGALLALIHVRHVLPAHTVKPIVTSLVVSTLRYCLSVYGTCGATEQRRLQKILNFCARVISGRRKRDHISDVLKNLKWLSIGKLIQYHRICSVRSIIESGHPNALVNTLARATDHGHNTRNSDRFRLPKIRTEAGRRQLMYSGVDSYNSFCASFDNRTHFKTALRKHLLQLQTP